MSLLHEISNDEKQNWRQAHARCRGYTPIELKSGSVFVELRGQLLPRYREIINTAYARPHVCLVRLCIKIIYTLIRIPSRPLWWYTNAVDCPPQGEISLPGHICWQAVHHFCLHPSFVVWQLFKMDTG